MAHDPSREVALLLVGVEEVTDRASGLTYGVVHGLPKGLEKSVARILDVSSYTYPIPVDLFTVEEAVGAVGTQVDQIAEAIERNVGGPLEELTATAQRAVSAAEDAEAAAMNAGSAAEMVEYGVIKVERPVLDLHEVLGPQP